MCSSFEDDPIEDATASVNLDLLSLKLFDLDPSLSTSFLSQQTPRFHGFSYLRLEPSWSFGLSVYFFLYLSFA